MSLIIRVAFPNIAIHSSYQDSGKSEGIRENEVQSDYTYHSNIVCGSLLLTLQAVSNTISGRLPVSLIQSEYEKTITLIII